MPFLGSGLLFFLFVIAELSQCVDSAILHTPSNIVGMTLVHKRLWTPDNGFKDIPAFFARAMSQTDTLACPIGECRDSERSELAQTPDMALRINHLQERRAA